MEIHSPVFELLHVDGQHGKAKRHFFFSSIFFVGEAPKPTVRTVDVLETVQRKLPVLCVLRCESLSTQIFAARLNESWLCRNTMTITH
jgi:hypothetical protein